jgi:hypothetical protein
MSQVTPSISFNLKEIELYSQDSFETLQEMRFNQGLDYYVCVITEEKHQFFFDAAKFFEHCIRSHSIILNPITRSKIEDLQVFVSSKKDPQFKFGMGLETLKTQPNHLPIYWNDPSFELHDRLFFMVQYAQHYASIDRGKATAIYKQAAAQGSLTACIDLVRYYLSIKDHDQTLIYLKMMIRHPECSIKNLQVSAQKLTQLNQEELAAEAYNRIAQKAPSTL